MNEETNLKWGKIEEEKIKNSENINNLEVEMVKKKTSTSSTYKKAKKAIKRLRSRY